MQKKLKITLFWLLAVALFLPAATGAETELTTAELNADTITVPATTDTLRFVLTAKWGFVRGNPNLDKTEKDYSGSIAAANLANAKIRLIKTLQWESHDKITTEANPVSWTAKIYGHWDGVRVAIVAKANETITVTTSKGNLSKTAKEWYELGTPAVADFGNNELLVVNTDKAAHRRQLAIIWWGAKNNPAEPAGNADDNITTAPKVDFSGTLTMDGGSYLKLSRTLRFEKNDEITKKDKSQLEWVSTITSGRDGLAVIFLPAKAVDLTSGFILNFPNLATPFSKHYTFEELRDGVRDTITIGEKEYIVAVGLRNMVKQVVKARGKNKMYLIEDNVKKYIPSTDVLSANGLENEPVMTVSEAELESYESGENLDYPEGTIVEEGGNKYVITNNFRRLLASNQAAQKLTATRLLKKITGLQNKYQAGPAITSEEELPDGSLVKTPNDSAIWQISGANRQVFSHERIFKLNKKKFDNVQTITPEKLQSYSWQPPVKYPDGALVKIQTDPKVYLLKNGKRRWIETEADFKGLGFRFSDVVDMPVTDFVNYPEGEPMVGDETTKVMEY